MLRIWQPTLPSPLDVTPSASQFICTKPELETVQAAREGRATKRNMMKRVVLTWVTSSYRTLLIGFERISGGRALPAIRPAEFGFDFALFRRIRGKFTHPAGYSAVLRPAVGRFLLKSPVLEQMAERAGFEPAIPRRVYRFSRPAPSTTRPPLRIARPSAGTLPAEAKKQRWLTLIYCIRHRSRVAFRVLQRLMERMERSDDFR